MGLLDIYNDYLKRMRNIEPADDFSGLNTDLMPPQTDDRGVVLGGDQRTESPLIKNPMFPGLPVGKPKQQTTSQQEMPSARDIQKTSMQNMGLANDQDFLQKMSSLANIDFSKAANTWKDKGGFEGLMSNPAFTIGLAFLQAGAEGKSLGQGALDNVIKAGAVSQQYKKIIESRKQAPIQATAADISETKSLLSKIGISEGNWFENFGSKVKNFFGKGGSKTPGLDYDKAVEEITVQYQAALVKKQKELKAAGKPTIIRKDDKLRILEKLIKSGVIQKNESFLSRLGITDATIQKGLAHGGTAHAGKSYLVGEKGPEVFIPKETGEVIANDDTQVFSMLLAANPQLQKVSKERAMKILKAKFPEYFD